MSEPASIVATLWALAVPFAVWPWAAARVYRRAGVAHASILGMISGPLWFGWTAGIGVTLLPGLPFVIYAAGLPLLGIIVGAVAGTRSTPREKGGAAPDPFVVVGALLVGALVFNTFAFPIRDHDILIADLFARKLSLTWDYWSLPRYEPDARGFSYPLAHPPAMMSLLAWLHRFSSADWVQRVPSAYLLAGFAVALVAAARELHAKAGGIVLALLFSADLYLSFLTNNSQDIYRYAVFAAGLAALVTAGGAGPRLVVAGALIGLAAAVHSLQVVFIGLIPAAWLAGRRFRRDGWREAGYLGGAAAIVASYPYLANLSSFGRPLIKTGSMHQIPAVNAYLREVMSVYADVPAAWDFMSPARLQFLLPAQSGWIGVAFAAALVVGFAYMAPAERRRTWLVLAGVCFGFFLLVLDPGNLVLQYAETSFWSNLRYPQTIFPVMIVVAAAGLAAGAARWGRFGQVGVLVMLVAAVAGNVARFTPDQRQRAEEGKGCVFCSDAAKLAADRDSGLFRAIQWLENDGRWRCLTFREAEYFNWSTTLRGAPYYSPSAERALTAPTPQAAADSLTSDGLNCVLTQAYGPMQAVLERKHAAFAALATLPTVTAMSFHDVDVWLLGARPVTAVAAAVSAPTAPSQSADFEIAGPAVLRFSGELHADTPVNTVAMLRSPAGWERAWLRVGQPGGPVSFSFVAGADIKLLHFWFSAPVTLSGVKLERLAIDAFTPRGEVAP